MLYPDFIIALVYFAVSIIYAHKTYTVLKKKIGGEEELSENIRYVLFTILYFIISCAYLYKAMSEE